MVYEKSCGAIVFRKFHGNVELLLIKHANGGHWSFPKGHVEQGESEVETAMREIKEETGIDVIVDPTFREVVSYSPKREIMKDVIYFIAKAKTHDYVPQEEEISEIKWVELGRVHTLLTYDNDKQLVNKAKPFLKDSFS
ncbi:MAG: NUDIX domain-containing protein [Massilioclostridium sp.]|nr:NUDIX domain-containing protein [Massilioclostridium sp.]MEE1492791.1 NUDIX domain-containing protein [Massilioclostridium sp.]